MRVTKHNFILALMVVSTSLLASCAGRHQPAPVVEAKARVPLTQQSRTPSNKKYHIVQRGETLYSIAWRANLDVNTIATVNNISSPYNIYPGQKLSLIKKSSYARKNLSSSESHLVSQQKKVKKVVADQKKQAYGETEPDKKSTKNNKGHSPSVGVYAKHITQWQWPNKGKVISRFSNKVQGNKGIDIAGERGVKIKAAADGKVVYAGDVLRGYGKLVIIKHNNDYLSAYAHNDSISVKEQQNVKAGEVIARMGDTDAERVMLHFEVRYRGKSVNPLKYLPKEK